jgi:hypothetical protein
MNTASRRVPSMLGAGREPMFRSLRKIWSAASLLLAVPAHGFAADPPHCLSGNEQRAAIGTGMAVPLASVMSMLHLAPREVVKARLCQEPDRLIYMLTLLGRDGRVKRATVDAANGAVVGER